MVSLVPLPTSLFALSAVGVCQAGCDGFVRAGISVREDRLVADRFVDDGEPLLPFVQLAWMIWLVVVAWRMQPSDAHRRQARA